MTFTTKKTKDLVGTHQDKYQEILKDIHHSHDKELTNQDKIFLQQSLLEMIHTETVDLPDNQMR